jgi:hypothetical protein
MRFYYRGKNVGQAFLPDREKSQARKPDLQPGRVNFLLVLPFSDSIGGWQSR